LIVKIEAELLSDFEFEEFTSHFVHLPDCHTAFSSHFNKPSSSKPLNKFKIQ